MEEYILKDDVKVFCVTAKSFPEGIQEAFITLEEMLSKEGRNFYGITHKNSTGEVIYKAAVSESFDGEAKQLGFETYVISKGKYLSDIIINWRSKVETISITFKKLRAVNNIDKSSACVEWYKNDKEMLCMVKID